jgi:CO dehydrogenase maturation factor
MNRVVAFAGKGGVGKTTLAAMLVRFLLEERAIAPVLAVDADPNANLNELLGVTVNATIGGAREEMKKEAPEGIPKDIWFEMKVNQAVMEGRGFDLLVMGRPEGPGCYCAANSLAKKYIEALRDNYPYVVIDNEAGMEHMSRLVTQNVDRLFVVSDSTPRGMRTAGRIVGLIGELGLTIGEPLLIVNRVQEGVRDGLDEIASGLGLRIAGMIRDGEAVLKADQAGSSIFGLRRDCLSLEDAYGVFTRHL